jgi:hypothetical protein
MLRMGSRCPICQRRPPAWAVTNAGLRLDLWFVSLDSEPALGAVVNLANSQLQHLFLYRLWPLASLPASVFARLMRMDT